MGAYQDLRRETASSDLDMRNFYLLVVTSGHRRMENLRRIAGKASCRDFSFFATLEDLHPARVLTAWRDASNRSVHLIGFFEDESAGEESKQRDGDGDEEEEDDDDGIYYDDEDRETWLP